MQDELAAAYPGLAIQVLGINERGQESANALAVEGRDLPWLQDVDQNGNNLSDVWNETWQIEYRDVVVLDGANEPIFVFNLTTHDLGNTAHYQTLRDELLRTAVEDQRPWCNADNFLDVDRNGLVHMTDFTLVLDFLNSQGSGGLPPAEAPTHRVDCDFDGNAAPIDALLVINHLKSLAAAGEGEAEGASGEAEISTLAWIGEPTPSSFAASPADVDAVLTQPTLRNDFSFALNVIPDDEPIEIAAGGEEDAATSRLGDPIGEADVFFRLGPAGN